MTTESDCAYVTARLHGLADGELPGSEESLCREHVRGCASCARALQGVERLKRAVAAVGDAPEPIGLRSRIRKSLGLAAPRSVSAPTRRTWLRVAGVAALIAVAVTLGHLLTRGPQFAYAELVRNCFREYDGVRSATECPESRPESEPSLLARRIADDVKRVAGLDIGAVPVFRHASYAGTFPYPCPRTPGVRVDFWPSANCDCSLPQVVSVFVIPVRCLSATDRESLRRRQESGRFAVLECGGGRENTIVSILDGDYIYNVVTRHDARVLCERLQPELALAGAPR